MEVRVRVMVMVRVRVWVRVRIAVMYFRKPTHRACMGGMHNLYPPMIAAAS